MHFNVDSSAARRHSIRRMAIVLLIASVSAGLIYFGSTSKHGWLAGADVRVDNNLPTGQLAAPQPISSQPSVAAAVDDPATWSNLFGPTHDSVAPNPASHIPAWGETGPREVWRVSCGEGYSSPIIWHDRLILLERIGDDESVSCLDVADGSRIWEQSYPTTFVCGSHYTNGPYSTPATDGERVYTLGAQGQLHCWSLADGAPIWSRMLKAEFAVADDIFGAGHSPLLWGDRLILNVGGTIGDSGIIAFDKKTGDILWQSTQHGPAFATPQPARIHDRDWLFVLTKTTLSLLDPETGVEQWAIPFEPRIVDGYNAVTPLVHGDLVMICCWGVGTKVLRIAPDGGYSEVWESKRILTSQYTPLLAVDGCAIGVHKLDGTLRCVSLSTGEMYWRYRSELANSKHIIVGDQILLFGEYGHLGLIECRCDELVELCITDKSIFDGEARCFSAPAYVNGRLYVRNESELVCMELLTE